MLFEEVAYQYIEDKQHGRKRVRPNTLEGYMSAIKCHLMPAWAGREVESITAGEMQAWVDSFELPGAAAKAFKTLRQIVRWYPRAHRVRVYDETRDVELPQRPRRKPSALTARQAKEALRDMRGQGWEPCALVQLSCGLRPCEAIALTWRDVNLTTGEVRVSRGLHEAFGRVYDSVSHLLAIREVTATINSGNGANGLSAPVVDGYRFAFWLQPSASGLYIANPMYSATVIWRPSASGAANYRCTAVYVRDFSGR